MSIITGVSPGKAARLADSAASVNELQQQAGRAGKQCSRVTPPAGARTVGSMHEV
ncbi:MAG: hypothetical protein M1399_06440 [Actinobacteria bacterium]|nr:hypothetical protein [Actinomycetota bacterium]MCL5446186.1 hypothetical protein [Actinomycetota bacterium]